MNASVELPEPWVEVERLPSDEQERLESTLGSRLTYADLTDEEAISDGRMIRPNGPRAMFVMGHRWVRIRNVDTDVEVVLRLQWSGGDYSAVTVTSVAVPFDAGEEVTGAMLRGIPLAAIGAAYTKHEMEGSANVRITMTLGDEVKSDPLEPLPPASGKAPFAARVAMQYMAIESKYPNEKPVDVMREINGDAPLSTVQRWVTRARKYGFLPPAQPR